MRIGYVQRQAEMVISPGGKLLTMWSIRRCSMGKWADRARQAGEPNPSANSAKSANSPPIGTIGSNGTPGDGVVIAHPHPRPSDAKARVLLREWHSKLEPLAGLPAPDGLERERWCELVGDAWWVYERFGSQLVRQSWSALDIFGIVPGETHLGGIIARLYGSRNLKLEGIRAIWSCNGSRDWACVGGTDCLSIKGIRPLWSLRP